MPETFLKDFDGGIKKYLVILVYYTFHVYVKDRKGKLFLYTLGWGLFGVL